MREKLRGWIVACAVAIGAGLVLGAGYGAALAQDGGTPPPEPFEGQPLPTDKGAYFAGSGACASCHTNMTDESGADVSIDAFWRATMMANAARDPYWLASVRVETLGAPELGRHRRHDLPHAPGADDGHRDGQCRACCSRVGSPARIIRTTRWRTMAYRAHCATRSSRKASAR